MGLIILGLVSIYLCYKFGDWKNWRSYYPTMLFYIIADFSHILLTQKKSLWLINSGVFGSDTLSDYFISLIIAPCIIILFLSNYPKRIIKRVAYTFLYVIIMSSIEYVAHIRKAIVYYNGWVFGCTIIVYIAMFLLFPLHHKNPLWAWLILALLSAAVVYYFRIPIGNLR